MNNDIDFYKKEPALRFLKPYLDIGKSAIDVGAAQGVYALFFSKHSEKVFVFEPLGPLARNIKKELGDKSEVWNCALSDKAQKNAKFYIPKLNGSHILTRSSLLEDANKGYSTDCLETEVRTLDSFGISNLSVLKIDVEGAEFAVLKGARNTIKSNMPITLVEIEERHHPGKSMEIVNWVRALGYDAFVVNEAENLLIKIEEFDFSKHQNIENLKHPFEAAKGIYLNNFLFLPQTS
ncbi:MAG: FkbM family methyltransferase [Pseudomonadales bacterium]